MAKFKIEECYEEKLRFRYIYSLMPTNSVNGLNFVNTHTHTHVHTKSVPLRNGVYKETLTGAYADVVTVVTSQPLNLFEEI